MIFYVDKYEYYNEYSNMYKFIDGDLYHFEFSIQDASGNIFDGWVRSTCLSENLIELDSGKIEKLHPRNLKEYFRITKQEFYNELLNQEIK